MARRIFALVILVAVLALTVLGHYDLPYQYVFVWGVVVFCAVVVLLMFWMRRRIGTRLERSLLVALLIAGAGQFAFSRGESALGIGCLLSIFPAVWLLACLESQRPAVKIKEHGWRALAGLLSQVAIFFCVQLARDGEKDLQAGLLWLAAVSLFLVACSPKIRRPDLTRWRETLRRRQLEIGLATVILVAGSFACLYGLDRFYGAAEHDEGLFGSEALQVLRGDRLSLFGWTWVGHTAVFTYLEAGSMAVFGKNITGLRVLPGVMSCLSLVFVYLLARRMFGVKLALVAASLFAFAPYRLLFSRLGIHDMVVLLFFPATVYFIYRGLHSRRTFDYALGGISLGIGLWLDYNNKSMILIPIAGAIFVYLLVMRQHYGRQEYLKLAIFLIGAVIVLLPLWSTLAHTNSLWQDPLRDKSALTELGSADQQNNPFNKLVAIARQVEHNVFYVNYYGDHSFLRWYAFWLNDTPVLSSLVSVFFFVGLAYSAWRWKRPRYAILLIGWLVGMLGGILTKDPPQSHRLAATVVPIFLVAAVGVVQMQHALTKLLRWGKLPLCLLVALFVGSVSYSNLRLYFSPESTLLAWEGGYYQRDNLRWMGLAKTGEVIESLVPDHDVYYVGGTRLGVGHGTLVFHSHLASLSAVPVEYIGDVVPLREKATRDVAFVMSPVHFVDLELIQYYYPGGELREWYDANGKELYVKVYVVPLSALTDAPASNVKRETSNAIDA